MNDINLLYKKYNNKKWVGDALGYIVYKRTYSRKKEDGTFEEWNETLQRCINGIKKLNFKITDEELTKLYDYNFNLKCSIAGRGLWQLGSKTVDKLGADSLVNCFSGDTEIITSEGIKKIKDLVNSHVKLMSKYGKYIDSEIKSFGVQKLYKINLTKQKSKKTIYATKNHRWFIRSHRDGEERLSNKMQEVQTIDLSKGDKLVSTFGQSIKGNVNISNYGILHGIVFGDGSVSNNVGRIRLCGKKDKQLLKYFLSSTTNKYKNDIMIYGLPKYYKDLPSLDMDKGYLYGWLAGYFSADGHIKKSGLIRLCSSNLNNLLFVKDVLVKLGISYSPITTQYRIDIGQTKPSALYSISINGSDLTEDFFLLKEHKKRFNAHTYIEHMDWKVDSIEETNREETVYCAVVPNTHAFVLEGNILTGNCWVAPASKVEDFCFIMNELMLGGGVGVVIKREIIHQLPKVKNDIVITRLDEKDADFIVPDTREGWVELLRKTLEAYLYKGKGFTYSLQLIRGKGASIKGFGGISSGGEILHEGIQKIIQVLKNRDEKRLRSIDVLDIIGIIGSIVVSGNVRRSAIILLGDPDDILFMRAKRWDLGIIPSWRAMSNNTIGADDFDEILDEFWKGYNGDGEAYGLANIRLARLYGRLGEKKKDNTIEGVNPCAEILESFYEACNLFEIFLPNIKNKKELSEIVSLGYKYCKNISAMNFMHDETNKIVHKNMRLGLSVTGICDATEEQLNWLDGVYKELVELDKKYSKENGWNESIRLTCVKPSGTLSLLAGVSAGVHPTFSKYYIRRVTMSSDDSLVDICKKAGLNVEYRKQLDNTLDYNSVVVEFPKKAKDNALLVKDMTAIAQLELVKKMQTIWADNSVSVTVYYKKEELDDIKKWLKENYKNSVKTVSFMLHSEHGFQQAPYEEIDEKTYNELFSKINYDILLSANIKDGMLDLTDCDSGACPVK